MERGWRTNGRLGDEDYEDKYDRPVTRKGRVRSLVGRTNISPSRYERYLGIVLKDGPGQ